MRTVELLDEVYARAERAAAARGMSVGEYLGGRVEEDALRPEPAEATGIRLSFPLISSDRPGTLGNTKALVDAVELADDLRRSGLQG